MLDRKPDAAHLAQARASWLAATVSARKLDCFKIGPISDAGDASAFYFQHVRAASIERAILGDGDLEQLGALLEQTWVAYADSWFGADYDLSVPFLLLFSRTRSLAVVAVVFFHVLTELLFPIGMFPWIMIAAATLLFLPDWPSRSIPAPDVKSGALPAWGKVLLVIYGVVQILIPVRGWFYESNSA